jgi:general secretion pathway protein C
MFSARWTWGKPAFAGLDSLHRLAPWIGVLSVLLLAHTLAELTWRWLPEATMPPIVLNNGGAVTTSTAAATAVNLDRVAALQLLGRADAVAEAPSAPIAAPETRLNLVLKGLLARHPQEEARAIIAQGSGDEKTYRVGDSLPGGASVHDILPDRVILSRGGRFETLTLPKERMDISESTLPAALAGREGVIPNPNPNIGDSVSQQLSELRDTLIQNPQDAMRMISAEPVVEEGQIRGYRVRPGQDRRLFTSVGLRPGDVVTAINGIALSDPAQLGAIYQQLSSATSLNVTVERRGRQTDLNINLE